MLKLRRDLIDNPASTRMKKVASLARRSFRIKHGLLLVEGPQAVGAVLATCPEYVTDVYIQVENPNPAATDTVFSPRPPASSYEYTPLPALEVLAQQALNCISWVHPITSAVAKTVAPSAQGVFATVKLAVMSVAFPNPSERSIVPSVFQLRRGFSVLLPETKDPGNLGTIIRLADACGVDQVLVCKGSADPTSPKVIRASAGSVFHLPVHYPLSFEQVALQAKAQAVPLLAADLRQSVLLSQVLSSPLIAGDLIWAFGNEAHGFTAQQLALVSQTVSLPMWGKAESLNVASAAAIILHATASRRHC